MHKKFIRPDKEAPRDSRDAQISDRQKTPVTLSFRYFRHGSRFCLSNSTQQEVREVMDCLRQTTTLIWNDVKGTGGKPGNKAGLGCTRYSDNQLRHVTRPQELSLDIGIYGLRASRGYRVFSAYKDHVLYVLWFDRNHEIVDG